MKNIIKEIKRLEIFEHWDNNELKLTLPNHKTSEVRGNKILCNGMRATHEKKEVTIYCF